MPSGLVGTSLKKVERIVAALLLAAVCPLLLAPAPPTPKEWGELRTFAGQARAHAREGAAVARERAIEGALAAALGRAIREVTEKRYAESAYMAAQMDLAKTPDRFIRAYKIKSEIPTAAEYLVALEARVDVTELDKALREGNYFAGPALSLGATPAAPTDGNLRTVTITVEGVRDYADFLALRAAVAGEVRTVTGAVLESVRGDRVRFRGAYGGDVQVLAAELNDRIVRGARLQVRGASGDEVVLVLAR